MSATERIAAIRRRLGARAAGHAARTDNPAAEETAGGIGTLPTKDN